MKRNFAYFGLLGMFGILSSANASAQAPTYWVGLGSFQDLNNAEIRRDKLRKQYASGVSIHMAETAQGSIFRVLTGPYPTEQEGRNAVTDAQQFGVASAWLVIDPSISKNVASTAGATGTRKIASDSAKLSALSPIQSEPIRSEPIQANTKPFTSVATTKLPKTPPEISEQVDLQLVPGEKIRLVQLQGELIKIDGFVDEEVWSTIPVIDDFVTIEPDTFEPGQHATRLRVAYSKKGMYVSAVMDQPKDTLLRRLTGRDVRDNRDSFSVTIDTSGEGRYGFWFGINLGDSLMDGTVLPERIFTSDWDGPWYGRTQKLATGWSLEMFIPWGIVAMPASSKVRQVGMYASRKVAYLDERWGWPALAPTQAKFMSALTKMEMEDVQPGQQYNLYPFVATAYDWIDDRPRHRAGIDMFWRPSTNFQMNATLNPDFGNVESDDVIINLSATETFFPEKRLFFLEGQEIFVASPRADTRSRGVGNGGLPYTMVNTRRIGGKPRAPNFAAGVEVEQREFVQPTELAGAVKTTGQIGRFRYGVMGAFEEEVKFDVIDNGEPVNFHQDGNDYGIARLLYEDNQGGAYRAVGVLSTAVLNASRDALVQGVDWHYLSPTGGLKVDGQVMSSDIDGEERGYGGFVDFQLTYRQGLVQRIGLEYFDEHIDINDLGFLQRNDEYRVRSSLQWTKSGMSWARENQFDLRGYLQNSVTENRFTGGGLFLSNRVNLNNLSHLVTRLNYYAPSYDDLNSFGNGVYKVQDHLLAQVDWGSDTAQTISYSFGGVYAEELLGAPSYSGSFGVTWRPGDQFALEFRTSYTKSEGWLLHQQDDLFATFRSEMWSPALSLEYFISARQQFRIAVQWAGIRAREDEFFLVPSRVGDLVPTAKPTGAGFRDSYDFSVSRYSLQLRYRWEIAPLSDVFLVYTRQANLGLALRDEDFNEIFDTAWRDPLADFFVFKIRYRFGS